MEALASVRVRRGRAIPDAIHGHRVGWFPGSGLVFAEGHPGGDGLGRGDDLPEVLWKLEEALWDYGVQVQPRRSRSVWASSRPQTADRQAGFAGVRRLDTTSDLACTRAEGLAVLAGVAALGLPGGKTATWRSPGGYLETVSFHGHSGRRLVGRWYDKSIEAGLGPRGTIIRAEDQRRYDGRSRRAVEELTTDYCRKQFQRRFVPLWRATEGVKVLSASRMAIRLGELVDMGELSPGQAELLAGYAAMEAAGGSRCSRTTRWRREHEARGLGLVLSGNGHEEVEIDLHSRLDRMLDGDSW